MPDENNNNVTNLPNEERLAQIRQAAQEYLRRADLPITVENRPYVRELAALLGSPEGWSAFATACRIERNGLTTPSAADLTNYLKDMKSAVLRVLREAQRREERGGSVDISNVEQMLDSDAPFMVCAGLLLKHHRGRIWYDEFLCQIRSNWRGGPDDAIVPEFEVNDAAMLRLRMWMMTKRVDVLGTVTQSTVEDAVNFVAYADLRDSLVVHVESLPAWDGVERLDGFMFNAFGCPVDDENGQTVEYVKAVGRNFLISMMARALDPGCKVDTMPVFHGIQGAYKSTAMGILGGLFFREISESPHSKDFYVQLQGAWLGEVAELASIASSRVETAKVKAMLSRRVDNFRPPYARVSKDHPRRVVMCGTTNQSNWMRDETGNRRYPTVTVGGLNLDWLRDNRDQLLAEALKEYRAGKSWWDLPADAQNRVVERFQSVSVYEDVLRARLASPALYDGSLSGPVVIAPDLSISDVNDPARWGNVVTVLRVAVQWLGLPVESAPRHQADLSNALTRLGWATYVTSYRENGSHRSVRCWRPVDREARERARREGVVAQIDPDLDRDIPF